MLTIDNQATQDAYADALTLGPVSEALSVAYVVANAAVRAQLAPLTPAGTIPPWGPEILLTPQTNVVQRVGGIRFRSAVAGTPARIVAQLFQPDDPLLGAGTVFSGTLSATGAVTPTPADQPFFKVARANSNQSIPNAVGTNVIFDGGILSQSDQFWNGATPDTVTIPASAGAGLYLIGANILWALAAGGSVREAILRQLGTNQVPDFIPPAGGTSLTQKLLGLFNCSVGDTIQVLVYQDTGGALALSATGVAFQAVELFGFKVHS